LAQTYIRIKLKNIHAIFTSVQIIAKSLSIIAIFKQDILCYNNNGVSLVFKQILNPTSFFVNILLLFSFISKKQKSKIKTNN